MRVFLDTLGTIAGFVFFISVACAVLRADDNVGGASRTVADNEAGFLVLQDGGVLAGQITRAADWYVVSRGGSQMQIAEARVMLVCRTLPEAYEFRRRQLDGLKVGPHLSLAEWCLRHNLLAEAGRELADARRLDPDQPRLALLERRLVKINNQAATKAVAAGAGKAQSQTGKPTQPATAIAGDLPEVVVERFTRKVQPVLVHNCTMAGCHQLGGKQAFQLDRAILRGVANRRSTMLNIEAALALVNREHPEQSPLITIPRKTHGGMAGPVFGPRQDQAFRHLVEWVVLITRPTAPDDETAGAVKQAVSEIPAESGNADSSKSPIRPVNQLEVAPTESQQRPSAGTIAAVDDGTALTLRQPHRLQFGARLDTWQPRDPFDPEIFNRLTLSQQQVPAEAGQPATAAAAVTR